MLKSVTKPNHEKVNFEYDALGRRTAKIVTQVNMRSSHPLGEMSKGQRGTITRFIWDGNVPLHEWQYNVADRPKLFVNEKGDIELDTEEPIPTITSGESEKLTTWVFEHGSFAPQAKIVGNKTYSIVCDYLGTPVQAFDDNGEKVWERELDIYGEKRQETGSENFIPFLYQGQYLDTETNLTYNRYRYYSSNTGGYISQDPIGLEGGDNLYAYVHDVNAWIDPFGLNLVNGIPQNPGVVRRFMSKKEYKAFKKNGFKYNPKDSRGGISTTSTKIKPRNPDAIKRSTGALGADYYVDIDTKGKNVELKGMTKGGVPDWKIKDDVNVDIKDKNGNIIKNGDIVGSGKVCKS